MNPTTRELTRCALSCLLWLVSRCYCQLQWPAQKLRASGCFFFRATGCLSRPLFPRGSPTWEAQARWAYLHLLVENGNYKRAVRELYPAYGEREGETKREARKANRTCMSAIQLMNQDCWFVSSGRQVSILTCATHYTGK